MGEVGYFTPMRVLALDTTTRGGSVALVDRDRIVAEQPGDATRTYAERLPRDLLDMLAAAGLTPDGVDLFAVAAGPGSFTGLRIGIAAMQGLALVTGRPMVAVSLLEALAHRASEGGAAGTLIGAWIDAHRGDVFSALYRVSAAAPYAVDRLIEIDPPRVERPHRIAAAWAERGQMPAAIAGDGAMLYSDVIGAAAVVLTPPPLAGAIGRMALATAGSGGAVHPAAVQPLYVRRPDVEIARDLGRDGRLDH